MRESELLGVAAAIYNHLCMCPRDSYTTETIHEYWNAWPSIPASIEVSKAALDLLELEGSVERLEVDGKSMWRASD